MVIVKPYFGSVLSDKKFLPQVKDSERKYRLLGAVVALKT